MATGVLFPNRLRDERVAVGIETSGELAARAGVDQGRYDHIEQGSQLPTAAELERITVALGGINSERLYATWYHLKILGTRALGRYKSAALKDEDSVSLSDFYRSLSDPGHLLVARDEVTWFTTDPGPEHEAEVFMNLSCGTQMAPHLLLDTVAVLERLDVSFVAVAGAAACCGQPMWKRGREKAAERHSQARLNRSLRWGARTQVNWCTACQLTSTANAAERRFEHGVEHPMREAQVLTFLEERVRELGDRVPWRRPVPRRVLVEGHTELSAVHDEARTVAAKLLGLVPGVEVVGLYDGLADESPCTGTARKADWTPPAWYRNQHTAEAVRAHRARLAAVIQSMGADTVAPQQQQCHLKWSQYASEQLAVINPISILAEALDCAHPDRYQEAVRIGDPDAFLARTRPVWQSWDMSETRARELATSLCDPKFAESASQGSCRHGACGSCRTNQTSADIVTISSRPS